MFVYINKKKGSLVKYGCATGDCQEVFGDCLNDYDCNMIAMQYLHDCQMILNGSFTMYCPYECKESLQAYINAVAPDATSTDFCQWYVMILF